MLLVTCFEVLLLPAVLLPICWKLNDCTGLGAVALSWVGRFQYSQPGPLKPGSHLHQFLPVVFLDWQIPLPMQLLGQLDSWQPRPQKPFLQMHRCCAELQVPLPPQLLGHTSREQSTPP